MLPLQWMPGGVFAKAEGKKDAAATKMRASWKRIVKVDVLIVRIVDEVVCGGCGLGDTRGRSYRALMLC